jgi:carbonic anhydrase/acetyltransferase-like protein (isoleucine patch superfamily)
LSPVPEPFRHRPELIDPAAFIAHNATVVGHVTMEPESSAWYGAVIRGDTEQVRIGRGTNIQDLAVLHADPGFPCLLGDRVTVGHAAVVHGAVVEDDVMIGMRAVVMNGAHIGRGSLVGVGAVVTEGTRIPAGSVVLGLPGKVVRQVNEQDRERILRAAEHYRNSARQFL